MKIKSFAVATFVLVSSPFIAYAQGTDGIVGVEDWPPERGIRRHGAAGARHGAS